MTDSLDTATLYGDFSSEQISQMGTFSLIVTVLLVIALWKIFSKAGEAGWKALIPIYNLYIYCKIADGNGWKFLLFLIPIVDVIYSIMLVFRLAKSFGKGVLFGFGLLFLPNIFTLILGFGKAQYCGPRGTAR